jgi:hypothetical protein
MGGMFDPLLPHRDLLRRRLRAILSTHVKQAIAALPPPSPIAVHVRRGDMKTMPFRHPFAVRKTLGLPLEWFIGCVRSAREAVGMDAAVTLFSDGLPTELRALLEMPNVTLAPAAPSIVDMFSMARSPLLITSGNSTFSGWGCFLGDSMSVWYPGSMAEFGSGPVPGGVEADDEGRLSEADRRGAASALKR